MFSPSAILCEILSRMHGIGNEPAMILAEHRIPRWLRGRRSASLQEPLEGLVLQKLGCRTTTFAVWYGKEESLEQFSEFCLHGVSKSYASYFEGKRTRE